MYERFTDRARKVMQLANQEAQRFNHEYIGTEHILLGLIEEGNGVGVNVLTNLDIDLRKLRLEVEKFVESNSYAVTMPRAKKVIEYSMEEARNLNHDHVGTEHILVGLLREQEGVAAQVLTNLGLRLEEVRAEVRAILRHGEHEVIWPRSGIPRGAQDGIRRAFTRRGYEMPRSAVGGRCSAPSEGERGCGGVPAFRSSGTFEGQARSVLEGAMEPERA